MKSQLLTLIASVGFAALAALAPATASAQNMDMSWGIRQQMQLQQRGDQAARNAAQQYYNYMVRLRKAGYNGPSLPTGITPQTLQDSNRAAQQAFERNHQSSRVNSNNRSVAVDDWNLRANRGCQFVTEKNNVRHYLCR